MVGVRSACASWGHSHSRHSLLFHTHRVRVTDNTRSSPLLSIPVSPELELLNEGRETRVCQLGSTVVTALQEGESKPKHCMLLEVGGDAYRATKIQLKTCR